MEKMRIVNINWLLDAMWGIIKRFNNKKTVAKMQIYSSGSETLLEELLKDIDI